MAQYDLEYHIEGNKYFITSDSRIRKTIKPVRNEGMESFEKRAIELFNKFISVEKSLKDAIVIKSAIV